MLTKRQEKLIKFIITEIRTSPEIRILTEDAQTQGLDNLGSCWSFQAENLLLNLKSAFLSLENIRNLVPTVGPRYLKVI